MLMTGDGVFSHRRGTKATYLLLGLFSFPPLALRRGAETPSHHSPNGPKPKYRQYSASAAPVFAYVYHQQQKVYILSGWSHQWTTRLLREALSELCKRATDGTMIQNPMARYLTLMYRLQCIKIVVRSADEGRQARWAGSADVVNHQTDGKYVYCEVQYT